MKKPEIFSLIGVDVAMTSWIFLRSHLRTGNGTIHHEYWYTTYRVVPPCMRYD